MPQKFVFGGSQFPETWFYGSKESGHRDYIVKQTCAEQP